MTSDCFENKQYPFNPDYISNMLPSPNLTYRIQNSNTGADLEHLDIYRLDFMKNRNIIT